MRLLATLITVPWWAVLVAQVVGLDQVVPDTAMTYRVEMKDGSVVHGVVETADAISVTMRTRQLGTLTIQKGSIRSAQRVDSELDPKRRLWYAPAEPCNYLLLPSARPVAQGRAVLRNKYIFVQAVELGITQHVSITGGVELVSLLNDEPMAPAVFLQAKGGGKVADGVHLALGATVINGPSRSTHRSEAVDRPNIGAVYGLATFGNSSSHLTVGSGFTFDEDALGYGPFLSVAATYRLSAMIALITENWVETENESTYWSLGIRFMGQGLAVDLAYVNSTEFNGRTMEGLPYVGFAVPL